MRTVAVIGGGPAGLMAAEVLSQSEGIKVDIYDAMPTVGRKFLMAGKGGMNLTHAEPLAEFLSRYGLHQAKLKPMLDKFTPDDLRAWAKGLGIETFVGSSGRVFPTDMKAAPLLRAWLRRLRESGVDFHNKHVWMGWSSENNMALCFQTPDGSRTIKVDAVVLALGGGSWARLGSTGAWVPLLRGKHIPVAALKPANCGFDVAWGEYFSHRFAGQPIKALSASFSPAEGGSIIQRGELMVTASGVEGGLIYSLSALLREKIAVAGSAVIYLDLAPDQELARLVGRLSTARGKSSIASYLRKRVGIDGVKAGLLREILAAPDFDDPARLGAAIKTLPIKLLAARPLEEAISSAGGVTFTAVDRHLMIRMMPGVFCAGEMLDWEAPTGGYLLTACLATGRAAGLGALAWLQ
ncbi:MAG: TIGR03862 family flavoprotein [Methylovulum sp.]|nr:TIGR03862 family flavoprotein [Methylovulum sp.]